MPSWRQFLGTGQSFTILRALFKHMITIGNNKPNIAASVTNDPEPASPFGDSDRLQPDEDEPNKYTENENEDE